MDRFRPIPPETWGHVDKVRAAVWDAIIELSAPDTSFVFSTDISASEGAAHAEPAAAIGRCARPG